MNASITTQSDKTLSFKITPFFSNLLNESEITYKQKLIFKGGQNINIRCEDDTCIVYIPKVQTSINIRLNKLVAPEMWEILNKGSNLDLFVEALKYYDLVKIWYNDVSILEEASKTNIQFTMPSSLFNFLYTNSSFQPINGMKRVFINDMDLSLCTVGETALYPTTNHIQLWICKKDCDKPITLGCNIHGLDGKLLLDTLKVLETKWKSIVEASNALSISF